MKAETVSVNEFAGAITFAISLRRGINIISGENGTGKTRLLQALKSGSAVRAFDSVSYDVHRVFAINPKRNSERRELNQIVQQWRRENKSFSNFSSEAINKHFDRGGFDNYSSFGELFLYYFDKIDRAGGNRQQSMASVVDEFNSVITEIFKEYRIQSRWDEQQGLPIPGVCKYGMEVPIVGLSCGEAELFSLVLNLYSLREQFDVFLIDEPETHLNWHLERLLFNFLKNFSEQYDKQLVIATHSRIVVDPDLKDCVQFLYWENGGVSVSPHLPRILRDRLVDDAYRSLKVGGFSELTIFCEDESHRDYLHSLLDSCGVSDYRVTMSGNCQNVKTMYKASLADGGWTNSIFLIDGDGNGPWKGAGGALVQIPLYCVENYALQVSALAEATGKSEFEIRSKIVELIKVNRIQLFQKCKSLNFLLDLLKDEHVTQTMLDELDASAIFGALVEWLGFDSRRALWNRLFSHCVEASKTDYSPFVDSKLWSLIDDHRKRGT